jgi:hypothetical protein
VGIGSHTLASYLSSEASATKPAILSNRTKTALRVFVGFLTDAGRLRSTPARPIRNGRTEQRIRAQTTAAEATTGSA